jgi:hypothetical protein
MIDYFNITAPCDDFPEIGKAVRITHDSGAKTKSFTPVKVCIDTDAPVFEARYEPSKKRVRFSGSPGQFIQCQNGMGSNDFQAIVPKTVALVCETLKISCPTSVRKAIADGNYYVHKVDVAEHYRLDHRDIGALCDDIRRSAPTELQATPLAEGIGIRLYPNSRDRTVLLYDKYNYFQDHSRKHRIRLLGNMPRDFDRIGTSILFDKMMEEYLAKSVRIETRFSRSLRSKARPLNRGHLWTKDSALELHTALLQSIPITSTFAIDERDKLLASVKDGDTRRLLTLWFGGNRMQTFFDSPATYFRARKRVLKQFGIDLSVAPVSTSSINWKQLIDPSNILPLPDWALEYRFVFEPSMADGLLDATQYERAWLRPVATTAWRSKTSRVHA